MSAPTFPALLTPEMRQVLAAESVLRELIACQSRPLAISLPQTAARHAQQFSTVLEELSLQGRVFMAHKATDSPAILSRLRGLVSIDVASYKELTSALRADYKPDEILATGPKSDQFLEKISQLLGITVAVDSYHELQRLAAKLAGRPVAVLLRLSRSLLNQPGLDKKGRFGLDAAHLAQALDFLAAQSHISLRGLAFHVGSRSLQERRYAVQAALTILLDLQQRGFYEATVLDIGGGYGATYGVSEDDAARFDTVIKAMVAGDQPSVTWQAHSYGLGVKDRRLVGQLSGVDVPSYPCGVDRLRAILEQCDEQGVSLATQLIENLVELWIEPGAAICADAGMVVSEVIESYQRDGDNFVVVDAHRNQICFENSEHATDPLLLAHNKAVAVGYEAYIVGHLCTETDFMTVRRIVLPQQPQPGDLVVWTHTGAYRDYFSASQSIGHPLPARYTLTDDGMLEEDV